MKLSEVFGVSPELAARLKDVHVNTIQDLADVDDLTELSARSQISLEVLQLWQAAARTKVAAAGRRRKVIVFLVVVSAILLALIANGSYRSWRSTRATAYFNRATDLSENGDYDGAIAEFRKGLALKPNYGAAHNDLGIALYNKGDYSGAIAEFRKALVQEPRYPLIISNLGSALNGKGDYDAAIAEYRKALLIQPDYEGPSTAWRTP